MKSILIICCFSLVLGRASSYNVVIVSPVESYLQKKQVEISKVDAASENSLQWKRRHKRRKKVRRPQRGR
tara:strand:+ start:427 stop:636 length:210 start_codon:yes stop_codon:yes gene_type:complete